LDSNVLTFVQFSSAFRRHFRSVEERLQDHMTWVRDSVLYQKISESEQIQPPPEPGSVTPIAKKKQRMFAVYQGEHKPKDVAINVSSLDAIWN
jgi:hypothetical protein